jgi:N-acetylmuramoyl-L-alanine amidase
MRRFAAALVLGILAPGLVGAAVLERVEVIGGDEPAVRLFLSAPATAAPQVLGAAGDARRRLFFDLPATRGPGVPQVVAGSGPLLRVRLGQFDARTLRVVLDFAEEVPFKVGEADGALVVTLTRSTPRAAAQPAPPPSVPEAHAAPPELPAAAPEPAATTEPSANEHHAEADLPPLIVAPMLLESDLPHAAEEPPQPTLRAGDPPSPPLIVVDPGHGGHDPGAGGIGGIVEKDVVLDIARLLATKLATRLGVSVMLTRSDDSFVPIERRLSLAPAGTATLFLSLHANACETPAATGLEVFYGGGGVRTASANGSSKLAALLGQSLGEALDASVGGMRGDARPGGFAVLVRNTVPSALVELGYLTHPGDAARACDANYQEMLTDALVEGVGRFLRETAPRL